MVIWYSHLFNIFPQFLVIHTVKGFGIVNKADINVSKSNPTATIHFNTKCKNGTRQVNRTVSEGFNIYEQSEQLEEYKNGYVVSRIDARDNHIEFLNGQKLFLGDVIGSSNEEQIRRIQIHETIVSHIERERQLFHKGIKVLSLFFLGQHKRHPEFPVVIRESCYTSRKTTWFPRHRKM